MSRGRVKMARLIVAKDGRLLGVHVPYNQDFITAAKSAGYVWTGKRFGDYWRYDERNLLDGSLTTDQLHAALDEKRAALVDLVGQFFPIDGGENV